MEKLTRPWQGTALGVIDIIGVVMTGFFFLISLFMAEMLSTMFSAQPQIMEGSVEFEGAIEGLEMAPEVGGAMFAGLGLMLGGVFLVTTVLGIFMAIGAFKGQKWSPILTIILVGLSIVTTLFGIMDATSGTFVALVFNAFVMYCAIMSVKSPFFSKKKV